MGYIIQKPRKNSGKKIALLLAAIVLFIVLSFLTFFIIKVYELPTLQGKWYSEETGEQVIFLEDGTVKIGNSKTQGIYHITSPNSMEYTIDNYTFHMNYRIENRKLYWGTDEENMECFRK